MKRNLSDIEDLFKSALNRNEEFPSSRVWDGIENILDKDDVITIKKKYNNLKRTVFLFFFLIIGLSIYELENWQPIAESIGVNKKLAGKDDGSSKSKNNKTGASQKPDRKITLKTVNSASSKSSTLVSNKILLPKSVKLNDDSNSNYVNGISNDNISSIDENKPTPYTANSEILKENEFVFPLSSLFIKLGNENIADSLAAEHLRGLLNRNIKSFLIIDEEKSNQQVVKRKDKKSSLFSLTSFFSPDFASYRLQNDQYEDAYDFGKNERHELSSTAGALIDYRFKKHLSIESGLTFSNTNIEVEPQTIFAQPDNNGDIKYRFNTSSGYGYILPSFTSNPNIGDSLYAFTSSHLLQYISLPSLIKFNFSKKKFGFDIKAGASVNFLTKGKVETSVANGTNHEQEVVKNLYGLKKIYFSGITGIGINYAISDKFSITFDPSFRYALNSINNNAPVKSYPNTFMFPIGLKIRL